MEEQNEAPIYDIKSASAAQELYCRIHKIPMFAPKSGICYRCGMNIYSHYPSMEGGYSVQRASKDHITDCPYCHRSYCD